MAKELKTHLHISNEQIPNVDLLVSKVCEWAPTAQPGKWKVHIFQDLTVEQRGYFHAVLVPHFVKIQRELGSIKTPAQAKRHLVKRFVERRVSVTCDKNGNKHEEEEIPSTEELSKEEYSKLIDDCCLWFIDYFGIPAPPPRESKYKR
jgi:hypothetical protein